MFQTLLYIPLFNILISLYNTVTFSDLGIAIVLLTIVIRLIFYPLFYKSFKQQTIMQKIQPEVARIQHVHKDDKEKQAHALMELYKNHKVNPFSGFLLILVQLPILIALYKVFMSGFTDGTLDVLYSFISNPGHLNTISLGLIDLQEKSIVIVVLAALFQYYQSVLSLPHTLPGEETDQSRIAKKMSYIGPVLTLVILWSLPAAVGVYWMTSSAFSVLQQRIINKQLNLPNTNGSR